ncbi:hypothetical protein QML37_31285, partial [Klebsiella pneumoniae]|uniref:hypothetical protein n=1 Tax=Klebsiella pneumoniae TaxID=573 RepID=UPI003A808FA8
SENSWVVDSGATDHMSKSPKNLINFLTADNICLVLAANDQPISVSGKGSIDFLTLKFPAMSW